MELKTNDPTVARFVLAWEIVKNVKHFEGKAFQENSEQLAKKQAELVKEIVDILP